MKLGSRNAQEQEEAAQGRGHDWEYFRAGKRPGQLDVGSEMGQGKRARNSKKAPSPSRGAKTRVEILRARRARS